MLEQGPLGELLRNHTKSATFACQWSVTGMQLKARARAVGKSAPGVDGWITKDLLKLPDHFWEQLALTVNAMVGQGDLPEEWGQVRCVLIPKPTGGTRPIGITSIVWRIAMSCILRNIDPWVKQWAHRSCHV